MSCRQISLTGGVRIEVILTKNGYYFPPTKRLKLAGTTKPDDPDKLKPSPAAPWHALVKIEFLGSQKM